ncbi:MAG: Bacterial polymerase, alpha chain terminal domain [Microvirga sp.]|jgi:hypothetical protein|nr:Bacterial polymerase, alpha chain terminal domain [Microvirga sp.]MCD6071720.1 Bacterial polymerase, alpha chain terminal domain [Microvirga sp.]MDF2970725.1 Bacterial polymerase, alpha chain terminal domain [Microvirga sp.]
MHDALAKNVEQARKVLLKLLKADRLSGQSIAQQGLVEIDETNRDLRLAFEALRGAIMPLRRIRDLQDKEERRQERLKASAEAASLRERSERNAAIYEAKASGAPLRDIARQYNISRSRISQIVFREERRRKRRRQPISLEEALRTDGPKPLTLDSPAEDLPLSVRAVNCLRGERWQTPMTIREVQCTPDDRLLKIPNLGSITLAEIRSMIPYVAPTEKSAAKE